jgi:hypothetical protein
MLQPRGQGSSWSVTGTTQTKSSSVHFAVEQTSTKSFTLILWCFGLRSVGKTASIFRIKALKMEAIFFRIFGNHLQLCLKWLSFCVIFRYWYRSWSCDYRVTGPYFQHTIRDFVGHIGLFFRKVGAHDLTYCRRFCHVYKWLQTGFWLVIGFIEHLQNVTTNNYDSPTELHTPNATLTTAYTKSSHFSLAVAW